MTPVARHITDNDLDNPPAIRPRSLKSRYLQGRLLPGPAIARRMLWAAADPQLLHDVHRLRPRVIVVETPAEWFDLIHEAACDLIYSANFVTCQSPTTQKNLLTQEAGLVSAMTAERSLVVIIAANIGSASKSVLLSADYRVVIEQPDRAIIASAIRNVFGLRRTPRLPSQIEHITDATALIAAIRPAENSVRAISRLAALSTSAHLPADELPPGPSLKDLGGYGAAHDWGMQLASDLTDYRTGKIEWEALSSAAILYGAPGVGKTLFATALARTCQVPLISTSLAKIFSTTSGNLDGVIKGLDAVFAQARTAAPAVLFIDELDSLPDRATLEGRGRDWWSAVCNGFLKLLDEGRSHVIVLAATNLIDRIDEAILRPGRIDRHFRIELPSEAELVIILRYHLKNALSEHEVAILARMAQGMTGAAVALAVKSARAEARRQDRALQLSDVVNMIANIDVKASELRRICVHEAGHALVALLLKWDVGYVSTIPGAGYGGASVIESQGLVATRRSLEEQVAIHLAGRNAERLLLGEASSGSHSDLHTATWMIAALHGSFGMGDTLAQRAPADASTALLADPAFRILVETDLRTIDERCAKMLSFNAASLERIVDALLEHRVLSGPQIFNMIKI